MQTPRDINFLYRNLGQYKNAIISFRLKYRPYRSEYRILAGKWIPGRNKKTPLFCCRFLRNWRSLKKNKNRKKQLRILWIFEKKNSPIVVDQSSCCCFSFLLCYLTNFFFFFYFWQVPFPPLLFFFVIWFHPAVNNFETCGKWWEVKKTSLSSSLFIHPGWSCHSRGL